MTHATDNSRGWHVHIGSATMTEECPSFPEMDRKGLIDLWNYCKR